ncbi:MAG: hypothetical protein LIR50_04290 [Bacillota bacterium]|nr:hypothetical protein [Bacillota bacterium]
MAISKESQAYHNKLIYIREYNKKSPRLYIQLNNKTEADLIEWLNGKRKATYIKQLIREDMKKHMNK